MGWDDIDFAKVITGMITRGPSEDSMADYLNTFSLALDERLNILIASSSPTLPSITFESNEIRNDAFWDKYTDLLSGYWGMFDDYTWYNPAVLSDLDNYTDYLIEESDVISLLGSDVVDILKAPTSFSRFEIFTAEILNSLYSLYAYLNIRGGDVGRVDEEADFINNTVLYIEEDLKYVVGGDSDFESPPYNSYASALAGYNSNKENNSEPMGSDVLYLFSRWDNNINSSNEYSVSGQRKQQPSPSILCKKLDDTVLTMDVKVWGVRIDENYIISYVDQMSGPPNEVERGAYSTKYPTVYEDDGSVFTELIVENTSQDPVRGTVLLSYEFDNALQDPKELPFYDDGVDGRLEARFPTKSFIDINNNSLEFHIP